MSGVPIALNQMMENMINGGKVALLGIFGDVVPLDMSHIIFKGLFVEGIYGREMFETWCKMGMLVQSGVEVERVITHRFGIDDFQKGFDVMRSGESGKVILDWA